MAEMRKNSLRSRDQNRNEEILFDISSISPGMSTVSFKRMSRSRRVSVKHDNS